MRTLKRKITMLVALGMLLQNTGLVLAQAIPLLPADVVILGAAHSHVKSGGSGRSGGGKSGGGGGNRSGGGGSSRGSGSGRSGGGSGGSNRGGGSRGGNHGGSGGGNHGGSGGSRPSGGGNRGSSNDGRSGGRSQQPDSSRQNPDFGRREAPSQPTRQQPTLDNPTEHGSSRIKHPDRQGWSRRDDSRPQAPTQKLSLNPRTAEPGSRPSPTDRLAVPRPPETRPQIDGDLRGTDRPSLPATDHEGKPFTDRLVDGAPKGDHLDRLRDTNLMARVVEHNRVETERGRYYWHENAGRRYCHYVDPYNRHWYGWGFGGSFYWSMWCNNYWWWYNDPYGCWNYWYGGYWWRADFYHTDIIYIYVNGDYQQYDEADGGAAIQAEASRTYYSDDGTRAVQIFGERKDAFLYDTTSEPAFNPVFLASNVKNVIFRNTAAGQLLKILVITEELIENKVVEHFDEFDSYGKPLAMLENRPGRGPRSARLAELGTTSSLRALQSGIVSW